MLHGVKDYGFYYCYMYYYKYQAHAQKDKGGGRYPILKLPQRFPG